MSPHSRGSDARTRRRPVKTRPEPPLSPEGNSRPRVSASTRLRVKMAARRHQVGVRPGKVTNHGYRRKRGEV